MTSVQMPPVPEGLRKMLKDYPDHVERLQQALNWVIEHPSSGIPIFERAIWALEGRLETFISEARQELKVAEVDGDTDTILQADRKLKLMLDCDSRNVWKASNLLDYFGFPRTTVHHDASSGTVSLCASPIFFPPTGDKP